MRSCNVNMCRGFIENERGTEVRIGFAKGRNMLHRQRAPLCLALCSLVAATLIACGSAGEDANGVTSSAGADSSRHELEAGSGLQAGAASITAARSGGETASSDSLAIAGPVSKIVVPSVGDFVTGLRNRTFLRINRGEPFEGFDANRPTIVLTHG